MLLVADANSIVSIILIPQREDPVLQEDKVLFSVSDGRVPSPVQLHEIHQIQSAQAASSTPEPFSFFFLFLSLFHGF